MYKLTRFLELLSHFYISFLCRGKIVYIFCGLRRSGNHACIDWVSSSLEGEKINYERISSHAFLSSSKTVIHLNEVNFFSTFEYIHFLRNISKYIRSSKYVMISLEDYLPSDKDRYLPVKFKNKIYISRSLLNTISSRITQAVSRAKDGIHRGDMGISERMFLIRRELTNKNKENISFWNYDLWLENKDNYRAVLLQGLGLAIDVTPDMSKIGGGSSFKNSSSSQLNRWGEIEWTNRLLNLIYQYGMEQLSADEVTFVESFKLASVQPDVPPNSVAHGSRVQG